MDFSYTPEEEKFRMELRNWLEETLPEGWIEGKVGVPQDFDEQGKFLRDWQSKLAEGGWAGISWPKEYKGRGATLIEEVIYQQEMARVNAPPVLNIIGIAMVGPTLLQIGTEEQKNKYIHKMLSGEEIWCQGYSEPGAGSDLAAIKTKAEKKGDKWIINGQKIWTSYAHYADRCFLLARTEDTGKKHEGITAFMVDMHQEGVETRRIRSIDDNPIFNELFLENAVVSEDDIVGGVGNGWKVGLMLLSHERVGVARATFHLQEKFKEVVELAKTLRKNGRPLIEDPVIRQKLVKFRAESRASLLNYYRNLTKTIQKGSPGPEGSIDKLVSSELNKSLSSFAVSMHGESSAAWEEDALISTSWQKGYLRSFGNSIEGGTSEIQKNIIAERILGLPKDIKY